MDKLNKNGTYSKGDEKDAYHKTAASGRIEYTFDDDLKVGEVTKWFSSKDYLDNGWSKTYSPDDSSIQTKI